MTDFEQEDQGLREGWISFFERILFTHDRNDKLGIVVLSKTETESLLVFLKRKPPEPKPIPVPEPQPDDPIEPIRIRIGDTDYSYEPLLIRGSFYWLKQANLGYKNEYEVQPGIFERLKLGLPGRVCYSTHVAFRDNTYRDVFEYKTFREARTDLEQAANPCKE